MTWQYNLLKHLDKQGLFGTDSGWVEHNTPNGWENLCHYWTFANPVLFMKLMRAIMDYSKTASKYNYYIGIGTCSWPTSHLPHHMQKHYFTIHRYPKNAAEIWKTRRRAFLIHRIATFDSWSTSYISGLHLESLKKELAKLDKEMDR